MSEPIATTENIKRYLNYRTALSGVREARSSRVSERGKEYVLCVGVYNNPGNEWVGLTSLCKIFGDKASTACEELTHLENEGLIERMPSRTKDSRLKPIKLTDKGQRFFEGLTKLIESTHIQFPIDMVPGAI